MRLAHDLASDYLPAFRNKFSRQDFTLAQLFACLVLRRVAVVALSDPTERSVPEKVEFKHPAQRI